MADSFPVTRFYSKARSSILLGADALASALGLLLAALLRFEGSLPAEEGLRLLQVIPVLVAARLTASLFFRLNRWSFRFSGLTDGARVGMAGLFGTGLWALGLFLLDFDENFSRAIVVLELLLTTLLMAALRFTPRLLWMYRADLLHARRSQAVRTLIVGAGAAGEMLLRDLRQSTDHDYHILGFVDDNPSFWGDLVGGRSILGGVSDIPTIAERFEVELVLIAIPELPARRLRVIVEHCTRLKLRFKVLASSYRHLASTANLLQNLAPEDVLERDEVRFRHDDAPSFSLERPQMVAGAAGSIGSEVCAQLLEVGCRRLVMLDINENGLYMLKRRFERLYPDRQVVAEVGDIRDKSRTEALLNREKPSDVFHAAACKHVALMETCPGEAVKTNVLGTRVLARAAQQASVRRFVFMSTDKAVHPTSVMGATKRCGELLVRHMAGRSETRFSVVRFGNVFDSAGSVIPVFREQIRAGGPVTVTHPEVTRYFMTIAEAVGLVLRAAYGDYGRLCVLEMGEPVRILSLARDLITMSGLIPDVDIGIRFTGLGPGEKLDEELLTDVETVEKVVDDKVRVVRSPPPPEDLDKLLEDLERATAREDNVSTLQYLWRAVGNGKTPVLVSAPIDPVTVDSGTVDSGTVDPVTVDSGNIDSSNIDSGTISYGARVG